ncbi:MAG: alpha/beta hydrolase [Mucilaginibacter sp.]
MVRLTLLSLLFAISLLGLFGAPTYHLWKLAVGVTEFPWVFIALTLTLLSLAAWVNKYSLAGTVVGVITLIVLLLPIVRANIIAGDIPSQITSALGPGSILSGNSHPFNVYKMFGSTKMVKYKTLPYVTYADTSLTLDYYPSQSHQTAPCVIVVHGGSWSNDDSKELPELNSYLSKHGYNVASINYRLAPKYKNPAPIQDMQVALKFLRARATDLKIDTNNFVLLGRSAGAQIALLAAYTLHDKNIKGVIDFYGPADMVWGYSAPTKPLVMDSRAVMERYLGGTYKQVPQNYVASSPIEFVSRQSPPTLILHGANDVLVAYEHSRRLNEKLQQNGVKHFWLRLPWATHGFDYTIKGPGGQLSTYAVERFLKAVTYKPE